MPSEKQHGRTTHALSVYWFFAFVAIGILGYWGFDMGYQDHGLMNGALWAFGFVAVGYTVFAVFDYLWEEIP